MSTPQRLERYASRSLVIGALGALLTGLVHWNIMTSPHNFLVRDAGFFIMLGALLVVVALSAWDFRQGLYVIRHMNEPHGKFTKTLAVTGITLGIADILPALILLAIIAETALLRLVQINTPFAY